MKLTIFLFIFISFKSFAANNRVELFDCAYLGQSELERVIISQVNLGKRTFHQLEQHSIVRGHEKKKVITVNFFNRHNNKVFEFTNGNTRIKIDFFQNKVFGRMPEFNIHSYEWFCKKF